MSTLSRNIALSIVGLIIVFFLFIVIQKSWPDAVFPTNTNNLLNSVSYLCNEGKSIDAQFYDGKTTEASAQGQPPTPGGSAHLVLSDGRSLDLRQTISASGVRYAANDDSFVFWSKGNGAIVLENDEEKSYIGCIAISNESTSQNLSAAYANSSKGFSVRLPSLSKNNEDGYVVDESYSYNAMGPNGSIHGVKFTVPESLSRGTNLSSDSYISVEMIQRQQNCSATLFTDLTKKSELISDNNTDYSVASTSDAGAGNRYEETIYAFPGTNPCLAIRYFVHYGVYENYPKETIKEFDKTALISQFDSIRRSLVIAQ